MTATTRRGFLAGALAGGLVPAAPARADHPPPSFTAEREVVQRGRAIAVDPAARRLLVAHDRRRTVGIAAPGEDGQALVDVGGQPVAVAVSPDGRLGAVATGFWDQPGLALVDLDAAALVERVDVGPAPYDVAFAAGGERIVVSGGEQEGTVHVLGAEDFGVVARRALGTLPRGIAPEPGGESAWIALAGLDRVLRVELASGRVRAELPSPPLPERVAVSGDGRRLLLSHSGLGASRVTELAVGSGRATRYEAGRLPSGVAWTARGDRLVVLGGAGELLQLRAGDPVRHAVGGSPRGLAVAGRRVFTVDALTGAVAEVRL